MVRKKKLIRITINDSTIFETGFDKAMEMLSVLTNRHINCGIGCAPFKIIANITKNGTSNLDC